MKTLKFSAYILIGALSVFAMQSCSNCINGKGNTVSQSRTLGSFSSVSFSCDNQGTIYVKQDSSATFNVQAQQNIIDDMQTEINGDELQIFNQHCIRDHADIIVNLTAPVLRGLSLNGEGEMHTVGKIYTDEMNVSNNGTGNIFAGDSIIAPSMSESNNGSGSINLLAGCTTMNTSNTGSGDITVNGIGGTHTFNSSGSGNFHGYGFITSTANISISGSSDVEVYVNDVLDVTISGSGNVYYKGNPTVTTHISGSGTIIHVN